VLQPNKETFYNNEALPLLRSVRGPIDAFTVRGEKEVLARAVETGEIEPGAFRNCAVFSDEPEALEQKRLRYEVHRATETLRLLGEGKTPSLDDRFAELYAQQNITRAVLVEAARKSILERRADPLTDRHAELYNRMLDTAQEELFPRPDRELANYASNVVLESAQKADPGQADRLIAEYPFLAVEPSDLQLELSPDERAEWKDLLEEKYREPFAAARQVVESDDLSNATLARATRAFMEHAGLPMKPERENGWEVIEREDVAGFRVEGNRLLCGRRKKEITWPVFEKLMRHEVGVHVTRAENGHRLGYEALQSGLPGYQGAEESLGILMEKLGTDEPLDTIGRDHYRYLTVCYADGFLDGNPHAESETLRFVSRLFAAGKPGGLDNSEILATARKTTFDHVKRAFRGMPEGKVMYSNLAYLAGKPEIIKIIADSNRPAAEVLHFLQSSKINPADPSHIALMAAAGEPEDGWL
jgi:hypothetical protein